eukprot:8524998-Pyramimonas_sp.AAC.1
MQNYCHVSSEVSGDGQRFGDREPIAVPDDSVIKSRYFDSYPKLAKTPESRWVSVFRVMLSHVLKEPDASLAIAIHDKPGNKTMSFKAGAPPWICAGANYTMRYLVELFTYSYEDDIIAEVKLPLVIWSSHELLARYHQQVQVERQRPRA